MKSKLLHESDGQKTYALVFETGDEVMSNLKTFARDNRLGGSHFTAIGAFQDVTLGYFDWAKKDYKRIPVNEQVEVVSLVGDVAEDERGEPQIHAHVVLGKSTARRWAATCWKPSAADTGSDARRITHALRRKHDPETGLGLIRL